MTEKPNGVREQLTEEIECGQSSYPTAVLTLDFDLIVAARDLIADQDKEIAKLERDNETLKEDVWLLKQGLSKPPKN